MTYVNLPSFASGGTSTTTTSLDYSVSTGFSFSSSAIGFTSGTAQLKNLYGPNVMCAATFSTTVNLIYSRDGGDLTGTKTGAVTISGAVLDMQGDENYKNLSFDTFKNLGAASVNCVRMRVTPNWEGNPSTRQWFFASSRVTGTDHNGYNLVQITDGNFYLQACNSANTTYVSVNTSWTPATGTTYELEANFDGITGTHNLYIDDTRILDSTATGTINHMSGYFQIGGATTHVDTDHANFKVKDLIIYDAVQNTGTTRTTGYTVPLTKYQITDTIIKHSTGFTASSLVSFTAGTTASGSDGVRFYLEVDGQAKYWNGSAWANSDATYAQSNSADDINTNCGTLLTASSTVKVVAVLHSDNGSTTPTVQFATVVYS